MAFTTEENNQVCRNIRADQERCNCEKEIQEDVKKEAPPASTIRSWHENFMTTGSLITPDKGNQARTSRNEET